MEQEASYTCQACKHFYHVRCMGTPDATSTTRQQEYSATCFLCQMAGEMAKEGRKVQRLVGAKGQGNNTFSQSRSRGTGGDISSNRVCSTSKEKSGQHELLIEDVMGVCDDPQAH
jgi:hypothetical protein